MNKYKENLKLNKWIKFTLCLFVIVLLTGCTHRGFKREYEQDYIRVGMVAKNVCGTYGQDYLIHYTYDTENWEVICTTKSPVVFITHIIE